MCSSASLTIRSIASRSLVAPNSVKNGTSPVSLDCLSAFANTISSSGSQAGPEPGPPNEAGRQ